MPDDADTTPDGRIEPSVRQITALSTGFGGRDGTNIGVIPPFSGILSAGRSQPGAQRSGAPRGVPLSYLTLEPLVTRHLRERTVRDQPGDRVEHVDRVEGVGHVDQTESGERRGDRTRPNQPDQQTDGTSMTVREFIREQAATESDESDGDRPTTHDISAYLTESSRHTTTFRQVTGEQAPPAETARADEPPSTGFPQPVVEGPPGSEPRGPAEGGARAAGEQPPLRLDTPRRARTLAGSTGQPGPSSTDSSGPVPGSGRTDSGGEQRGSGPGQPALVLPQRPPITARRGPGAADAPSSAERPSGSTPVDRGHSGGHTQDTSRAAASTRQATAGETDASDASSTLPSGSEQSRQDAEAVPLALDRLKQPTLDRFVEQLSDELARHERIERERRGL